MFEWIRKFWNRNLVIIQGSSGESLYEVDEIRNNELGRGGFGIVYKGRNIRTREEVAVKKVAISNATKKFVDRELQFMNKCKHKNIIKMFWSQGDNHVRYFVIEYCPFGNLNKFMKDKGIYQALCLGFMGDLGDAVWYLHHLYIAHRDIKPFNVLVKKENGEFILKLADFGLARHFPVSSTGFDATPDAGIFSNSILDICFKVKESDGAVCFDL